MPVVPGAWDHLEVMDTAQRAQLERSLHLPERLVRSSDNRVVAGVCGGLGAVLGVDPTVIRLAVIVLTLANGVGFVAYLVALAVLPKEPVATTGPTASVRPPSGERAVGVGLITLGALLLFGHLDLLLPLGIVWAAALSAVGFALVWARTDQASRTRGLLLRSAGGGLLLVVGLGLLFASGGVLSRIGQLGVAVLATGVGVVVLLGPWIMRLLRDLSTERRERIRSEERSEIAAHLHDSVLQTLALIQRADAPGRAKTLARRQERELRAWLFDERPPDGHGAADLGAALAQVVTDVEDRHDVEVDLVLVGNCPLEPRVDALVAALREAAHNAARHSGVTEVSVYVEVQPDRVEAYVRDRGAGFVLDAVESGRLGVRESIIGSHGPPWRQGAGPHGPGGRHGGHPRDRPHPGPGGDIVTAPRVFLVDDHQMFRAGVRAELGDRVDVVGEAGDVESAIQGIRATDPEVVLLDVHLPGGGGKAVLETLKTHPSRSRLPRAVGVRRRRGRHRRDPSGRAGLRHQDHLLRRPRRCHHARAGRRRGVLPRLAGFVLDAFAGGAPPAMTDPEMDQLTTREREVMRLIARGYTYKEIARRLSLSIKTVETHVSAVLRKLQLSSRHELTRWATDRRLI